MSSQLLTQSLVKDSTFNEYNSSNKWVLAFQDNGNEDWTNHWFLDGEIATVTNTDEGMHFVAGPVDGNDAHHAVLWTKKIFEGDLKIEFNYTKTDTRKKNVTILYIHASGVDKAPFVDDISVWNDLRKIPSMRMYFNNMDALHISYAAFTPDGQEYVRARRYPASDGITFKQTMILPSYDHLDNFFQDGIQFHITVLKTGNKLFFQVKGKETNEIFFWDLSNKAAISNGRIGLRHMFTRSALYKDFKIYTKKI
ncbi:MAG: DUF1961 family protein [Saprospiraceae bacterium]|nr:DUF1961 family protein [Saprospiraceae bacterium]